MAVEPSNLIDPKHNYNRPFFNYGGASGLITTVAAGSATAGHLYVLRNPSSTKKVFISRVRLAFHPTVAFGAAQAMVVALFKMTGYSAAHTGGTAITPAKRITSEADASVAAGRIGTTGALTAGTHTIAGQPLLRAGGFGTTPAFEGVYEPRDDHPLILEEEEGLLVRNEVLMGASGVGVLAVEIDGWER
jgi:hypothetical protein